jgi:protein MpaA
VDGRPITVIRRGTAGGTRVLAVGAIHGNEDAGTAIIDQLAIDDVPEGVELWLVRSMNPDGQANRVRQNSNAVDLNRNFPHNWGVLGEPGLWQYGGPGPASEPETKVMVALGDSVRPDLILWYHQDLFRISPASGRDGQVRARYAEIAGLPIISVTGGTYTGTASQWSRIVSADAGVGFTVELGAGLTPEETVAHAEAVRAVAAEFF